MLFIIRIKQFFLLLLISTLQPAYPGWIQSLAISERCASMGGACVARADDYGAFYHNPAATTKFNNEVLGINLRALDTTKVNLKDSEGNHGFSNSNTEGRFVLAPTIAGYLPINDSITLGLGLGAPFAITADWSNANGIHRYNMSDQSLFVLDLTPTFSFKVNEKLSFGLGVNVIALKQLRVETLIPDSFGAALPVSAGGAGTIIPTTANSPIIGRLSLQTDDDVALGIPPNKFASVFDEFSITLGLHYDFSEKLSLGIVYRSKTKMQWDGKLQLDLTPAGMGLQTTNFNMDFEMPAHVQAGFAYQFIPNKLIWSFDVQWTNWSDAKGVGSPLVINVVDPLLGFVQDLQVDYDSQDSFTFRTGTEYLIDQHWSVLAGYAFDESVFDNAHVDILTYDTDRHIFSAGVTYDSRKQKSVPGWIFHLGGQAVIYTERNIAVGESQNLGGLSLPNLLDNDTLSFTSNRGSFEYGGAIYSLALSVQYNF